MRKSLLFVAVALAAVPVMSQTLPTPPVAPKKPHVVSSPHGDRDDPYYWLRDDTRKDPDVLAYLEAENAYLRQVMAPVDDLRAELLAELTARLAPEDADPPYPMRGYAYASRYETGKEYEILTRRPLGGGAEQVMLDENALAEGHSFFSLGQWDVSLDNQWLAYATDTVGRRQYVIQFRNLKTGETLPTRITGTSGNVVWAGDHRTVFYVEIDPQTLLTKRVKRHVVGTDPATDVLVYEEPDDSFYMGVFRTVDNTHLCIALHSTVSSEARCLRTDQPTGSFTVLAPRERDFEYDAEHAGGRWVIRTNWQAKNFRLMEAEDAAVSDRTRWRDIVAHRDEVFLAGYQPFADYIAVEERRDGLQRLRVIDGRTGASTDVAADEPTYVMHLDMNREADTTTLRYVYESLTTPKTIFDLNMQTGVRTMVKVAPVLGGFDSANYETDRLWVDARDGTRVPVSLAWRKGTPRDGTAPLYQYAYGSYGYSTDPSFRRDWVSLLDRGFVVAIAHIRGGQEMGRQWYEDGKLLRKKNSFTDFVDVTRALTAQKVAAPDKVFAMGGSAGGLLMGAVVNMAPELYRGIVAHVPFVDVVTTMLDESIPLTTNEFDEWGNPTEKVYYDYMLSYSPYDQVETKAYPAILATTGLWDSQVQYWEPAKWVARLRAMKTDDNPLLLRTNMDAGHGGRSGRFTRLEQVAVEYAFLLQQLGTVARVSPRRGF
jgi:oligopeptidase B